MRDARCVRFSSHISTFVHTPHWSSTSPAQLQVPAAIPAPSHTPQRSTALPLFATPSHPAQLEPSPPHVPHASVTSPAQLHLPAGIPEPPQTCLCVCVRQRETERTREMITNDSIQDHEQARVSPTSFLSTPCPVVSQGYTHRMREI